MMGKIVNLSPPLGGDNQPNPEGQGQPGMVAVQKIRFVENSRPDRDIIREFQDPYPRVAVRETLEWAGLPAAEGIPTETGVLLIIFLASGHASPYEWRKWAEEWIAADISDSGQPLIEVMVQNDRVCWRNGRAVVIGAPDRWEDIGTALVDFAFHEMELRKLESEVERGLEVADRDVSLTHEVGRREIRRWSHINERTEAVTRCRMRFARLEPRLEKSPLNLGGPARRLYSELLVQTEIADRLGFLDDRLEVLEDLYELANDRLSEFSYFSREYRLEMAIFVILFIEVLLMLWEIYKPGT